MYKYCMKPSVPTQQNAFAEYGTLGHRLLEGWAKDELFECDLAYLWETQYASAITCPFPYASKSGYDEKYYEAGKAYFSNFHGFGEKWSRVLGAEEEFTTTIDGFRFKGIVDLILQCPETGEILLIDHKSKSLSAMKQDMDQLEKQLLIYAGHIREKYGRFPDLMQINLFKEGKLIDVSFDHERFLEAQSWVSDMALSVSCMTEFPRCKPGYYCENICSVRDYCLRQQIIENPGAFMASDV